MRPRPFVLMIAGPNGSGKTTLTDELRRRGFDLGDYINADDIAAGLEGPYPDRVTAAQAEAEARRQACIAGGRNFSFETVMSHPSKIDLLRQARAAGFQVLLYFVSTEAPELNVARVRQRVALGGHPVPEDRIVARYARTMALLPDAVEQADRVVLFDNSTRAEARGPVILRPFLMFDAASPAAVRIEHPVPAWGRPVVEIARRRALAPS